MTDSGISETVDCGLVQDDEGSRNLLWDRPSKKWLALLCYLSGFIGLVL